MLFWCFWCGVILFFLHSFHSLAGWSFHKIWLGRSLTVVCHMRGETTQMKEIQYMLIPLFWSISRGFIFIYIDRDMKYHCPLFLSLSRIWDGNSMWFISITTTKKINGTKWFNIAWFVCQHTIVEMWEPLMPGTIFL